MIDISYALKHVVAANAPGRQVGLEPEKVLQVVSF